MNKIGLATIAVALALSLNLASSTPSFANSPAAASSIVDGVAGLRSTSPDQILLAKGEKKPKKAKKAKKVKKAKKTGTKKCEGLRKAEKKACLRSINKGADKGKKKGWFK
jgi:flagellar biosynthesis/type III secretory pathway protein FliH